MSLEKVKFRLTVSKSVNFPGIIKARLYNVLNNYKIKLLFLAFFCFSELKEAAKLTNIKKQADYSFLLFLVGGRYI